MEKNHAKERSQKIIDFFSEIGAAKALIMYSMPNQGEIQSIYINLSDVEQIGFCRVHEVAAIKRCLEPVQIQAPKGDVN